MTEIRFYHLERQSVEQALPALVSKAYENGHRIVIKVANDSQREQLNEMLWTYHPNAFLPHGSPKDGNAEHQSIWLTTEDENPNRADVLILVDASESGQQEQFKLCCEVFNGRDENILSTARERWKAYKDAGDHDLTYWQQGDKGWEQKV